MIANPFVDRDVLRTEPIERAETIPAIWYVDPTYHDVDRDAILRQAWQFVGHKSQVLEPGDYVSANVLGEPVLVVRDKTGALRAFYNVCRHRGGPLVTSACGSVNMLQCKYHGWTYHLDGTLRGVPRFDRSELFDKKDYGLVELELRSWQGLMFVALEESVPALDDVLSGIGHRIAPIALSRFTASGRQRYNVECNWKVYVDNYLEGYHLPLVHPELCDRLDYRSYRTETNGRYSLQHSALGDQDGEAFYYYVYPNLMLNILPDRLQTNTVIPLAPNKTLVIFDYYYADTGSPESRQAIEEDHAFSEKVQHEDIGICEAVQRGLQSSAYDRGRFSPEMEQGVYHFHCLLRESYRSWVAANGK